MANPVRIFVSHSHEDNAWCREFVEALRRAGADVWYDEHNLGSGILMDVIERQLRDRPVFVVILSDFSIKSHWVRLEIDAAIRLQNRNPGYVFLPVVATTCEIPLLLGAYKYVSGPNDSGLPAPEAAGRVAHAIGIASFPSIAQRVTTSTQEQASPASNGASSFENVTVRTMPQATVEIPEASPSDLFTTSHTPMTPQQHDLAVETIAGTLARGKDLFARGLYAEAEQVFEHATQLDPDSFEAWIELGNALSRLGRNLNALAVYDRALLLDPNSPIALSAKAIVLKRIGRHEEAGHAAKAAQIGAGLKHRFTGEA